MHWRCKETPLSFHLFFFVVQRIAAVLFVVSQEFQTVDGQSASTNIDAQLRSIAGMIKQHKRREARRSSVDS